MTEGVVEHPQSAAGCASNYALLLSGVWLVFLVEPVLSQWDRREEPRVVLAMVAAVVFAGVYLAAVAEHVRIRREWRTELPCGTAMRTSPRCSSSPA
jgi:hypothetical protein